MTDLRRSWILSRVEPSGLRDCLRPSCARLHARRRSSAWSGFAYWNSASAQATSASNWGRGSLAELPAKTTARVAARGRRWGRLRALPPGASACGWRESASSASNTRAATFSECLGLAPISRSMLASVSRVYAATVLSTSPPSTAHSSATRAQGVAAIAAAASTALCSTPHDHISVPHSHGMPRWAHPLRVAERSTTRSRVDPRIASLGRQSLYFHALSLSVQLRRRSPRTRLAHSTCLGYVALAVPQECGNRHA